jgi:hypothetical protein
MLIRLKCMILRDFKEGVCSMIPRICVLDIGAIAFMNEEQLARDARNR